MGTLRNFESQLQQKYLTLLKVTILSKTKKFDIF